MAAQKQLSVTLEEILAAARARRWESGRRGEGVGGREVADSYVGSDGTLYNGTDKVESQVVKCSCVETRRLTKGYREGE